MLTQFVCFWLGGMTATTLAVWMESAIGYPPIFRLRPLLAGTLVLAAIVAWPFTFVALRRYYERMEER